MLGVFKRDAFADHVSSQKGGMSGVKSQVTVVRVVCLVDPGCVSLR